MKEYDLIVIGAGPGGYRAASYAAAKGLKVVVFEAAQLGGTCLNEGCIPTKCYARHAEVVSLMKEAGTFGISHDGFDFHLELAKSRKDEVLQQLRSGIETLLSHPNISLVRAEARFLDAHTVEARPVCDDSVAPAIDSYTAPSIIIATGSVPKCLPIEGASIALDSRDMLQLDRLPESLCIIGAGVIGMEFASIFSAFGTKVRVVEFLKECLPALDSDIAKRLRKVMEKRGVEFNLQCAVKAIEGSDGAKTVSFVDKKGREQRMETEQILMAVGRAPRVFDHFHNAGFDFDDRTGIKVNDDFETTVKGVYAIGDCNGRMMLAHAAEAQAKSVVDHIVTAASHSPLIVPAAIFTEPEAACAGISEDQLKADGTPYECRKAFWRSNGKALAMNETEGMLKLFSEPDAGRIIGCHAYGAHAADLVQEASVLMSLQTSVRQLRDMVHIHPTLSEILLTAAEQ